MFNDYRMKIFSCYILICFGLYSCVSKVYPDERMGIDSSFLKLFNSVVQTDTFSFKNLNDDRKSFVVTKVDSIISNKKGWFINEAPYKLLRVNFRESGKDTLHLERPNEVFVNKDPATGKSSLNIEFNNFYFYDTVLPLLNHDTININDKKITNYYLFKTSLKLKQPDDVKELYISPAKGFIGFKTVSGEVWINEQE